MPLSQDSTCCNSTSFCASPSSRRQLLFAAVTWPAFTFTQLHYLVFILIPTSCPWLHCPLSIRDECQVINIYRCLHQVSNSTQRQVNPINSEPHWITGGISYIEQNSVDNNARKEFYISGGFQCCCWESHMMYMCHMKSTKDPKGTGPCSHNC